MGSGTSEIRWGIIGCGDVTEVKSGPAFSKIDQSELVAVMRRNAELAEDYARRHGVPRWYDDVDRLIEDPDVNAIYVATPPDSHAEYTIRALRAGKPVYVEKPMARTYKECIQMLEAAEQAQLPLLVAYYRRRLPSFEHVRKIVGDGRIGDIRLLRISLHKPGRTPEIEADPTNWRVVPEIAGGGHFVDLASHQLDYLDYVFGPVTAAGGLALNLADHYAAEDTVTATWQHASGVPGVGSWCFVSSPDDQRDELEIIGSQGRIRMTFFGDPNVYIIQDSDEEVIRFQNPPNIQLPLIETVVSHLLGGAECPSTGLSAARTSRVIEDILASYYD